MKIGKPKSKRVPVRLRHKIEKASAAKQRKNRKLAKNDPTWRSKLKKDPGIPNLFPYKEKLLQDIEEKKRLKEEEKERIRLEARERRATVKNGDVEEEDDEVLDEEEEGSDVDDDAMDDDDSNPMAALLASARARAAEFDHEAGDDDEAMEEDEEVWNGIDDSGATATSARKDTSRKAFDKIFKQVVDAADVILYVLDARDPEGTRSKEVERMVMAAQGGNKRLILILNKIDLIPANVLKAWLTHLRRYFPTLPLRASNPAPNARTFDHKQMTVKGTSEALFKALKSYAEHKNLKRSISVGVIGYPNVGKSSVINALTSRMGRRNQSCPTGAEAGVTTALREVKLDNKLKLLDSPGIVFPSTTNASSSDGASSQTVSSRQNRSTSTEEQARLILLNAIPPRDIADPIPAVSLLLKRLATSPSLLSNLLSVYDLPPLHTGLHGDITTDFLVQVARKRGRLGKGGVPNLNAAAMTVVSDWRDGRIQGWVEAPRIEVADAPSAPAVAAQKENAGIASETGALKDQKAIVKEWAEEFKLDGLWGDDTAAEVEMGDA